MKSNQAISTQTFPRAILFLMMAFMLVSSPLTGEKNKQENDIIIEAMKDELDRSMKSLKIEKMEKPYYLEYSIWDNRQLQIQGSFGSLTKSEENHLRLLKVGIRVGSYQLDSSGFVSRRNMFAAMMGRSETIALEDDYNAIRNSIWRLTDRSYKRALEVLAGKKAFLKNQVREEEIPDFSREKSVQRVSPCKIMKVNREKWEKIIKNLSAVFRQFPGIHKSHVEMEVKGICKYFVNSEGTVFRQPETLVSLVATASTQAAAGMSLKHYIPFYASTINTLPDEKELAAGIRKMAKELTALAAAPVLKEYIGPVLFTQQASAELFIQVLVPNLSGQRPPLSELPQMSGMSSSGKLAQRLNRKVLPRGISIIDDPTRRTFEGKPLIGFYSIDDEGVTARPVTLVEKGTLKALLMSRRPRKEILNSNGHGRAALRGNIGVQIGNLLITTDKGKTYRQLKDELLQLCKDQQLPFGLIIKTVDNPSITGVDRSALSLFAGRGKTESAITSPVLMYKVHVADGREELVRGISVSEMDVGDLKDIAAVGSDYYVHHRMLPAGGGLTGGFFSIFFSRGGSSMGVPTSIAAPSVLFEEVEFKKSEEKKKKPPLLTHPFFPR